MSLDGKVCLITGGAQGLGFACAQTLAEAGAHLALLDIDDDHANDAAAQLRTSGSRAIAYDCDVTSSSSVTAAVEAACAELGPPDILINNAGIGAIQRTEDHDEAVWDAVINVSLKGTFLCSREVGQRMITQGNGGLIVNMASIMGLTFMPTRAAYASAKAAIIAFTKVTASEWARYRIRVNALAPGYVLTEGIEHAINVGVFAREDILARIPAGRLGTPKEVASAVRYLASLDADYITGHILVIDGGYTAYGAWWPAGEGSDAPFRSSSSGNADD